MNRFNRFLVAAVMLAVVLFTSAAQAMDINDYFKMADQDQGRFDNALFEGAKQLLKAEAPLCGLVQSYLHSIVPEFPPFENREGQPQ